MRTFCRILIFTFSIFCSLYASAQDLIVTNEGDSLNCKITKQEKGFVFFAYRQADQIKRTMLPTNKVSSIQKGYYSEEIIVPLVYAKAKGYDQWRYGLQAGYSYRVAKVSDQLPSQYRDYIKKLKSGYVIGGDIHYFTSEILGFGLKYNFNKAKNNLDTDLKDDITLHYIGASLLNRLILTNPKNSILFGVNLGYQSYRDKSVILSENLDITGKNLGAGLELGFDHKISPACALNLGVAVQVATLNKITVDDGFMKETIELEKENLESLTRIEFTIGLKFLGKKR